MFATANGHRNAAASSRRSRAAVFGVFLSFFLPPDSPNYIYRSFRWLTEWIYRPVAWLTPSAIPPVLIAPVTAFWVAALRVLLFMVLYQLGLTPRPQAPG